MKSEALKKLATDIALLIADRAPEEAAMPAPPPLLTALDVAARLQINKQAVYRLTREGKLSAIAIGPRTLRWTEEAVSAFITQGGINVQDNAPAKNLRLLQAKG